MNVTVNIINNPLRIKAWVKIANAQTKVGCSERAIYILDSALSMLKDTRGRVADVDMLVDIANAQTQAGRPDLARFTLKDALDASNTYERDTLIDIVDAKTRIANAQIRAGQSDFAIKTLQLVLELVDGVKNHAYHTDALTNIANAQAEAGHPELAKATLERAEESSNKI